MSDTEQNDGTNSSDSLQVILERAMEGHLKGEKLADIDALLADIENLEYKIHIKGDQWDGYVTTTTANFVRLAEKKLKDVLIDSGVDKDWLEKKQLVKIRVKDGSADWAAPVTELVNACKGMTYEQLLVIIGGYVVICGINKVSAYKEKIGLAKVQANERLELAQIEKKGNADLVEAIGTVLENNERPLEAPMRGVQQAMDKGDTIELPDGEEYTKRQLAGRFVKQDVSKMEDYHIDAHYVIEDYKTPEGQPDQWKVELKYGHDVRFTAKLKLDIKDDKLLGEAYAQARAEGKAVVDIDLQVTAEVNSRRIRNAEVVGVGKPRDNARTPAEALLQAQRKADIEHTELEQEEVNE
ncbi:hypothetical protein ACFSQZ_03125 [Rubritalea spongiae]|uniref:Uncharacterized protein n=2 Tax=Rubritalea spongiae TaxID=430797 RepID=A0ABW5DYN8_9BACT